MDFAKRKTEGVTPNLITFLQSVGLYNLLSHLAQAARALPFVGCDKRKQKHAFPERSERSHNHRFSFYLYLFSLPFLLTFAVCSGSYLSVIIPFLLSSVRIVSTARLCLKLLPSLLTATFLLSKKLTQLSLTLRCLTSCGAQNRLSAWSAERF